MINQFKLSHIGIEGIQSYYDYNKLVLDENINFVMIDGQNISNERSSNGTGKTTLFKQLMYGLGIYGKIPKSLISKGLDTGKLEILLDSNDKKNHIHIKRYISSSKQISSELEVVYNGEEIKFQRSEYFKNFLEENILGCSLDIYKYLKFFTQDNPSILNLNNAEIIKIFEKIFRIDKLDEYYLKQNTTYDTIIKDMDKLDILKDKEEKEIETQKKSMVKTNNNNEIDSKIESIKKELNTIIPISIEDISKMKDSYNVELEKYKRLKDEISTLKNENINYTKEQTHFEKLLKSNICPTCTRPTKDDESFKEKSLQLIKDKKTLVKQNNEKLLILENQLKELTEFLSKLKKDIESQTHQNVIIEQKTKHLNMLIETKTNLVKSNLKEIEESINDRNKLIESFDEDIKKLNDKKEIYSYLQQILGQKSKIRQNILSDILSTGLKHYVTYYSSFLFNDSKVDFFFDKNNFNIGILEGETFKEYNILSQGEKKKVELIFTLSMNDLINSFYNLKMNLFIFDEFFDNLDETSINQSIELLNQYSIKNNQLMILTTHKKDLNILNSMIVNIVKENSTSNINEIITL